MVGSGHSFTAISAPRDVMLRPQGMQGIIAVDRDAMTVTAYAGTRLAVLNAELERLGLSLHNMGDIAEQTLAGAVSTGTHGTGGGAGLAANWPGSRWRPAPASCPPPPRRRTPTCSGSAGSGSERWGSSPP